MVQVRNEKELVGVDRKRDAMHLLIVSFGIFSAAILHVFAYKNCEVTNLKNLRETMGEGALGSPQENVGQNRFICVIAD